MKKKDLIYLMIAVVILLVAGYVVYANLVPKSTSDTGVKVDKIGAISGTLNSDTLSGFADKATARDFSSPVEFSGLGNTAPFGK